jgi:hypothetical protein
MAWIQDRVELCVPTTGNNTKGFLGINNAFGTISEVSHRHGVITYIDNSGEFLFHAILKEHNGI